MHGQASLMYLMARCSSHQIAAAGVLVILLTPIHHIGHTTVDDDRIDIQLELNHFNALLI